MNTSYVLGALAGIANVCGLLCVEGPTLTEKQRKSALPLLILPVVGVYKLQVNNYVSGLLTTGVVLSIYAGGHALLYPKPGNKYQPVSIFLDMFTAVAMAGGPALIVALTLSQFDLFRYLGIQSR